MLMRGLLSIFHFQDLPWTLNIEVDKRAMLTTGQNTSPPPPPENCFENWKFLLISRGSHAPPLLPPRRDRRDGREGLSGGMLEDKTGESCPISSPDEIVLSSGHGRPLSLVRVGGTGCDRWVQQVAGRPRRGRGALGREGTNTEASTDDYPPPTQRAVVR